MLQLLAFVNGLARMECGMGFLDEVATFMLWPTAETTVEEKHARVSMAKRKHYIAPVRVSLSNGFPLFERLVLNNKIDVPAFYDFSEARVLRKVAPLFNLETHPLILEL